MRPALSFRALLIVLVGLTACFYLVCEEGVARATRKALDAHQLRVECLVQESAKDRSCKIPPHSDDFDYCKSAVTRCVASGKYAATQQAEADLLVWQRLAQVSRIAVAIVAASLLAFVIWLRLRKS
jgi:hypothetical protein